MTYSFDLKIYECICRYLLDIVVLLHEYEQVETPSSSLHIQMPGMQTSTVMQ